ncbi:hypothetical protein [Vandammella animalimorsus]|uniref:hypothetical protein n=1 Tax=Vandammella animalimorsus TaxID=2029117 RepID=UPI0011786D83|nr:hypothetical protein [Vandammella animalimorsus]
MPFDDDPPSTPASQALRAWHATLIEATRSGVRPAQGVFIQAMPPLAASARAHDFRAAEWKIVDIAGEIHAQEQDYWSARAYFSPEQTHCALLFAGDIAEWLSGTVVWVDGESVPVPRGEWQQPPQRYGRMAQRTLFRGVAGGLLPAPACTHLH